MRARAQTRRSECSRVRGVSVRVVPVRTRAATSKKQVVVDGALSAMRKAMASRHYPRVSCSRSCLACGPNSSSRVLPPSPLLPSLEPSLESLQEREVRVGKPHAAVRARANAPNRGHLFARLHA